MNLIGDVKGKVAVMLDDMIDTAGKSFQNVNKNQHKIWDMKYLCCLPMIFNRLYMSLFQNLLLVNRNMPT